MKVSFLRWLVHQIDDGKISVDFVRDRFQLNPLEYNGYKKWRDQNTLKQEKACDHS